MIVSDEAKDVDWQTFKRQHAGTAAAPVPVDEERAATVDDMMTAVVGLPLPGAEDDQHHQHDEHQ